MANSAALRYQHLWKTGRDLASSKYEPKFPPLLIPALTPLLKTGVKRGSLIEIHGLRSSGRSSFGNSILAAAAQAGETCAVIDLFGTFAPARAAAAGVALDRLVWIRCGSNAEHALRATDLLLHAGGFGVVLLDLCDASTRMLNRIPLSYWYRFRRAVENTTTILAVCADRPQAKSCSSHSLELQQQSARWQGEAPFALLCRMDTWATHHSATLPPHSVRIKAVA